MFFHSGQQRRNAKHSPSPVESLEPGRQPPIPHRAHMHPPLFNFLLRRAPLRLLGTHCVSWGGMREQCTLSREYTHGPYLCPGESYFVALPTKGQSSKFSLCPDFLNIHYPWYLCCECMDHSICISCFSVAVIKYNQKQLTAGRVCVGVHHEGESMEAPG